MTRRLSRTFTWTSSNPAVATVDMNGQVIFLSAGSGHNYGAHCVSHGLHHDNGF